MGVAREKDILSIGGCFDLKIGILTLMARMVLQRQTQTERHTGWEVGGFRKGVDALEGRSYPFLKGQSQPICEKTMKINYPGK